MFQFVCVFFFRRDCIEKKMVFWMKGLMLLCVIMDSNIFGKYIEWNFKDKLVYISEDGWNNNNNNCDNFKIYLNGNGIISDDGLECNDNFGYSNKGINKMFNEKTLEAYVLRQRKAKFNAGIISIDIGYDTQNNYIGLHHFDAIEYSGNENDTYKYIAKSDSEITILNDDTESQLKYDYNIYEHIVIVYNTDNSINIYYNGELYSDYTKGNLTTFDANQYRFLFCKTHGPVLNIDNNNLTSFDGMLIKSAIHDYALSSNEVSNLYQNRNVSNGEHACNMLIPELTTLDICDNIHVSFIIRINKLFPTNQEIFGVGSSYTVPISMCLYNNICFCFHILYYVFVYICRLSETVNIDILSE